MMTEEEVELIYDYLHENYEYRDGDLFHTTAKNGIIIGDRLGFISFGGKKRTQPTGSISVNKVKFTKPLAHFIYIFFNKKSPDCIKFIDENPMNTKIENLISISRKEVEYQKSLKKKGFVKYKNKNGSICFLVIFRSFSCSPFKINGGSYANEEKASHAYFLFKELDFNHKGDYLSLKKKIEELKYILQDPKKGYYKINDNKWVSRICINNKYKYLGCYNTKEEAQACYLKAKEQNLSQ